MKFELTILGCGSAVPSLRRGASAQVLNVQDRLYLIDCGEGTQLQLRKFKIRFQKISAIFISHLHGDHYLGLMGFLSSLDLLGRSSPLTIFSPQGLEEIIKVQLSVSHSKLRFPLKFHVLTSKTSELIYEDKLVTVVTIPLKHRVYCNGFLFSEKKRPRNMIKNQILKYNIPVEEIPKIQQGEDFIRADGVPIANSDLTTSPLKPRSFAYVSDTGFYEKVVPIIGNVDLLYHEATFTEKFKLRAKATGHSTAKQAAQIAEMANVKRLLLGHFSARYDTLEELQSEAEEITSKEVLMAEDGMTISVPQEK